ncbi:MAG: aminoacyl-tRNA hydrolase [Planctomycetales bacterium]|nr:aminoacyl-tRNA hydrolase [Planctomycetales bacterium]
MKLVIGLGNPGPEYEGTRHNVGYRVVEELARRGKVRLARAAGAPALVADARVAGTRLRLAKPTTFMNVSGEAARALTRRGGFEPGEVLVVLDDTALPLGKLRLRASGSSGGHNGLGSVLDSLGTEAVPRLRLGIGAKDGGDLADYVLARFGRDEMPAVEEAVTRGADAVALWARVGTEAAMNRVNARKETEPK